MSFILNAIRKSEQERQVKETETLEHKILDKQEYLERKTPFWVIFLLLINIIFLVYFIGGLLVKDEQETKLLQKKENSIVLKKDRLIVPIEKISLSAKEKPAQFSIAKQIMLQQVKKPKVVVKTVENNIQAKPKQIDKVLEKLVEVEKPLIKPKLLKTNLVIKKTKNVEGELPFLTELSYEFRRTVPVIDINVFVYSEKKQNRFIMIEMKKFRVGGLIAKGMQLKEIRINSIVVQFKNKEFQIKRS